MKIRCLLTVIFLNALIIMYADEMTVPVFPEISVHPEASVVLQLATVTQYVNYREPLDMYVRFINQKDMPVNLQFDEIFGICLEQKIKYEPEGEDRFSVAPTSMVNANLVVLPKNSVIIKIPSRLLFLGNHKIIVKYKLNNEELRSNRINIEVHEKPLDDIEKDRLTKKYEKICDRGIMLSYTMDARSNSFFESVMIIGSPYSIPFLKKHLQTNPLVSAKVKAAELLGIIADKDKSVLRGYIRNTSAADLVIERIDKESYAAVKTALLKIIGKFFDVLDQPQREKLEKTVLALLTHTDAGVRVQTALTLLELFPAQRPAIKTTLAKPDFADEAGRKKIVDALAKTTAGLTGKIE